MFVSLAETLRAAQRANEPVPEAVPAPPLCAPATKDAAAPAEVVAAVREAKRFRARLADALDDAVARLLRDLAARVLARELRLAPCDLAAVLDAVVGEAPVVHVRVAPEDAGGSYPFAIVADPALAPGDAIVELVHCGIDARLGVRLATVLESL